MLLLVLACDAPDSTQVGDDDTPAETEDTWTPAIGVYTASNMSYSLDTRWMSVANVGDLDGDGVDELAVATQEGVVFVSADLYGGTTREVRVTVEGVAGRAARLGNDQYALVGATVGVYQGLPVPGAVSLLDAPTTIALFPHSIAGVGDVDGDTLEDVALQYAEGDGWLTAVFSGPLPNGSLSPDSARTLIEGSLSVLAWGDLDGDGTGDLVGRTDSGSIVVLHGPLPEGRVSVEAAATARLDLPWPWLDGTVLGIVGDLDGDGRDDLAYEAADAVLLFSGVERSDVVTGPDRFVGSVPAYGWFGAPYGAEWPRWLSGSAAPSDADADSAPGFTLAATDGSGDAYVLSWYDAPPEGTAPPLADVVRRFDDPGGSGTLSFLTARLGGPAEADVVAWWNYDDTLHFARAFDVAPGDDPDRDGFGATEDCDEADPTVHPGAPEVADGRDQDCDGLADEDAGIAKSLPEPPDTVGGAGNRLGSVLSSWDDDGDGAESLVAAGELDGAAAVWVLPPGGSLTDAAVRRLPYDVAAIANGGDLNGDGLAELLVTESTGLLYVAHAPLVGDMAMADDPSVSVVDLTGSVQATGTLASIEDIDGDGIGDFLTGGASSEYADFATSAVLLFSGDSEFWDRTAEDAWATFAYEQGQVPGRQQGQAVGDVDGDGTTDLVIGTMVGSWLFLGPVYSRTYNWGDAPVSFDASGEVVSSGDLDGDGAVEVYLAAPAEGRVVGFEGPFIAGAFDATDAIVDIGTAGALDGFGTAMLARGDTLVVTAPWSDGPGVDAGRVFGFLVPVGILDADEAAAWMFDGAAPFDGAGSSLAEVDNTGDGTRNFVTGIPWRDGTMALEGGLAFLR